MKFKIKQNKLIETLNPIKTSRALGKYGDEYTCSILIEANIEEGFLEIVAFNLVAWSSSRTHVEEDVLSIEEGGITYLDGQEFISVISTYPKENYIEFTSEKNTNGDISSLNASCVRGKRTKKTIFPAKEPKSFERYPEKEDDEQVFAVLAKDLSESVMAVEYVSSFDDRKKYLWGVQIEVHENGIVTFASDLHRMCYCDKNGVLEGDPKIVIAPQKNPLLSIINSFSTDDIVSVKSGSKRTTLSSRGISHTIPNVTFSSEEMPAWKEKVREIERGGEWVTVNVPKEDVLACIKTAQASASGKFGITIKFSYEEEAVEFSVTQIANDGYFTSSMQEKIPVDKTKFSRELNTEIILTIEGFRDAVSKLSGEEVSFLVKDNIHPIGIYSEKDKFGFITVVVDPGIEDVDLDNESEEGEDISELVGDIDEKPPWEE